MLILSGFKEAYRRITIDLAIRRNSIVAALADDHYLAHVAPGSHTERLADEVCGWPK
jgi:putative heme iron utilization protein